MFTLRTLLIGMLSFTVCTAQPPPEILQAEIQQLKTVIESLREENRVLESRNQQLMSDILQLGTQLRLLREHTASAHPEPSDPETPVQSPEEQLPVKSGLHPILSVNMTWHYLIVKAGSASGIEVGERGSVMRDGDIIATVRVTDAKPNQSIVQIDIESLSKDGVYPRKDDQVRFP